MRLILEIVYYRVYYFYLDNLNINVNKYITIKRRIITIKKGRTL